jgi:hypothetical protein
MAPARLPRPLTDREIALLAAILVVTAFLCGLSYNSGGCLP